MAVIGLAIGQHDGGSEMKNYKAQVRINGRLVEIRVQARNFIDAKTIIEGQYGKGSITTGPNEVH